MRVCELNYSAGYALRDFTAAARAERHEREDT